MPEKEILNYLSFQYIWVIAMSIWGGIIKYLSILNHGKLTFKISCFLSEIFISSFAGIIAFLFCESANINHLYSAALIGVTGHMGSRAIFIIEGWLVKKLQNLTSK